MKRSNRYRGVPWSLCLCFFVLYNRHWFNRVPGPVTNLGIASTLCPYSGCVRLLRPRAMLTEITEIRTVQQMIGYTRQKQSRRWIQHNYMPHVLQEMKRD